MKENNSISLKLSDELIQMLDAEAKRRDLSRSDIIREAVAAYGASVRRGKKTVGSLAAGLAGSLDGGPGDLATNKSYFDDFGK